MIIKHLKAVDSHPRRMNGFLTGCLLQVNIIMIIFIDLMMIITNIKNCLLIMVHDCKVNINIMISVVSFTTQVLQENIPNISDIPKFLNNQMLTEG